MTNKLIQRFTDAKLKLAEAQTDYDTAVANRDSFISTAYQAKLLSTPCQLLGYTEQTAPVSHLGKFFDEGTSQGWTLKALRPVTQFAVVLVWQTAGLTKKAVEQRCKDLAQSDWQRDTLNRLKRALPMHSTNTSK
ncbi:hypothetical protein [Citrobacter portucalensis]|uniref:hypothetical protein n=1 Tax=Citrobacter portucalensis TaxID=1639133 RepID=UPI00226B3AAB|nr:hypothetical protein [Citrobacter portucalensis]MCX9021536.1 hypothetical protein [Citrobacter portucalensis]